MSVAAVRVVEMLRDGREVRTFLEGLSEEELLDANDCLVEAESQVRRERRRREGRTIAVGFSQDE